MDVGIHEILYVHEADNVILIALAEGIARMPRLAQRLQMLVHVLFYVETDHILPGHHDFLGQEVGKVKDVVDELAFYRIELPFLMAGRDEHADFIFRVDHVDFIGHIEILPPQDDLAEPVAAGNKAITETAAPIEKVAHPFETFFRTLETYGLRYELAKDPEAETDGKDQANVDDNRRPARHDLPQEGLQMIQDIGDNRAGGHAGSDHANLGRT